MVQWFLSLCHTIWSSYFGDELWSFISHFSLKLLPSTHIYFVRVGHDHEVPWFKLTVALHWDVGRKYKAPQNWHGHFFTGVILIYWLSPHSRVPILGDTMIYTYLNNLECPMYNSPPFLSNELHLYCSRLRMCAIHEMKGSSWRYNAAKHIKTCALS